MVNQLTAKLFHSDGNDNPLKKSSLIKYQLLINCLFLSVEALMSHNHFKTNGVSSRKRTRSEQTAGFVYFHDFILSPHLEKLSGVSDQVFQSRKCWHSSLKAATKFVLVNFTTIDQFGDQYKSNRHSFSGTV